MVLNNMVKPYALSNISRFNVYDSSFLGITDYIKPKKIIESLQTNNVEMTPLMAAYQTVLQE